MGITLINQSTAISDEEVGQIAEACNAQLQHEVALAWDIKHPLKVSTTPDATSFSFFLVDDIPEAQGRWPITSSRTTASPPARSA
jgi:hypothetical protein